jgi:hypothetical protein
VCHIRVLDGEEVAEDPRLAEGRGVAAEQKSYNWLARIVG